MPRVDETTQTRRVERAEENGDVLFAPRAFEQKGVQPRHRRPDVRRIAGRHEKSSLQETRQQRGADTLARYAANNRSPEIRLNMADIVIVAAHLRRGGARPGGAEPAA